MNKIISFLIGKSILSFNTKNSLLLSAIACHSKQVKLQSKKSNLSFPCFVLPSRFKYLQAFYFYLFLLKCPKLTAGKALTTNFPLILHFLSQSPTFPGLLSVTPNKILYRQYSRSCVSHKKDRQKLSFPQLSRRS